MAAGAIQIPDFDRPANDQGGSTPLISSREKRIYTTGGRPPAPPAPPALPPADPRASDRKYRAKRINEHIKAAYSLLNTVSAAIFGAAYILPEIKGDKIINELDRPSWLFIALCVFTAGHAMIRLGLQKED